MIVIVTGEKQHNKDEYTVFTTTRTWKRTYGFTGRNSYTCYTKTGPGKS
jgi:hypothetical protein